MPDIEPSLPPHATSAPGGADIGVMPVAAATPVAPTTPLGELEWKRVSPKYLAVEMISTAIWGVLVCVGLAVAWQIGNQPWAAWVLAGVAALTILNLALEPRRVRSIGYVLRADDLLFRRGLMFHRIVAVPYGRMQLIDINRGPLARALGLADLKFVTAAATTAVAIPGLKVEDATELRDRLVELAESRRAGL